jgi:hypothetical protein
MFNVGYYTLPVILSFQGIDEAEDQYQRLPARALVH